MWYVYMIPASPEDVSCLLIKEKMGVSETVGIYLLCYVTLVWDDQISHFQVARKQATYLVDTGM